MSEVKHPGCGVLPHIWPVKAGDSGVKWISALNGDLEVFGLSEP
jgi:hypothetical protein